MAYVVSAKVSRDGRRVNSRKFTSLHEANDFADRTKRDRPGSNPRVKKTK